jgi:hypothetical protein
MADDELDAVDDGVSSGVFGEPVGPVALLVVLLPAGPPAPAVGLFAGVCTVDAGSSAAAPATTGATMAETATTSSRNTRAP